MYFRMPIHNGIETTNVFIVIIVGSHLLKCTCILILCDVYVHVSNCLPYNIVAHMQGRQRICQI